MSFGDGSEVRTFSFIEWFQILFPVESFSRETREAIDK